MEYLDDSPALGGELVRDYFVRIVTNYNRLKNKKKLIYCKGERGNSACTVGSI